MLKITAIGNLTNDVELKMNEATMDDVIHYEMQHTNEDFV